MADQGQMAFLHLVDLADIREAVRRDELARAGAALPELTLQQQRFASEYVIDLNATKAAIRAGYSEKTAYASASTLLKNVEVSRPLSAMMLGSLASKPVSPRRFLLGALAAQLETSHQPVQPGLLRPGARHRHAALMPGGTRRIPHSRLAKPLPNRRHEPVQFAGHTRIGSPGGPDARDHLLPPPQFGGPVDAVMGMQRG